MAKRWCNLIAAGLVGAMALGCGAEPTGANTPRRPVREQPARPLPPAPVQQQPGQDVQALVAGVRQAKQTVTGFTGEVETYENGSKGTITETLKIAFKKPSTLKIEVVKSSGGNKGTELLWTGGKDCKVKPGYLPFPVSIAMSDDRLLSKNGWEIRETEVNSIMQVLLDPQTQLKLLGTQPVAGKPLTMLAVTSPATPKGGTREVIGLDPHTNLPGVRMIYQGEKLIYRLTIKRLTMRTPSSSELEI